MDPTADELAGVVDVLGALTRSELAQALAELAFKRDEDVTDVDGAIDDAVASYHLVAVDPEGSGAAPDEFETRDAGPLLVPGPAAFPEIPEGAEDLPHILDVPERPVDRERVATGVADRFREETAVAVRSDDAAFVDRLLDVSYELEAWGAIDVAAARQRLLDWEGN